MDENVPAQLCALRRMTLAELRERHLQLFGTETRSRHKDQLFKRLAWRIQELEHGGLSDRAKRRAAKIASDLDARYLPPRKAGDGQAALTVPARIRRPQLLPGTVLQREYRGEVHQSLSGVAKHITGTSWNGNLFFGLRRRSTNGGRNGN
jgi:hypothetical protein